MTNYAQIKPYIERLKLLGYGFSVLEEPKDEINHYDRETFIELLNDWGWAGSRADKPHWLPPRGSVGNQIRQQLDEI